MKRSSSKKHRPTGMQKNAPSKLPRSLRDNPKKRYDRRDTSWMHTDDEDLD